MKQLEMEMMCKMHIPTFILKRFGPFLTIVDWFFVVVGFELTTFQSFGHKRKCHCQSFCSKMFYLKYFFLKPLIKCTL